MNEMSLICKLSIIVFIMTIVNIYVIAYCNPMCQIVLSER